MLRGNKLPRTRFLDTSVNRVRLCVAARAHRSRFASHIGSTYEPSKRTDRIRLLNVSGM
jgi:hypothetical protein